MPPWVGLGDALLALWRLSRPETWMVTFLPVYAGWVLASQEIFPGFTLWTGFFHAAGQEGATFQAFLATLGTWLQQSADLVLALTVMGPLLWTATLLINDVHDLPGDMVNPRKVRSPLVQGIVTRGWAHVVAYLAAAAAIGVGLAVSFAFAALVAACLALAWLYSVPPVRLKTRPGADVAVNAIGVGLLSALAGWSIASDVARFPILFALQGLLVAVAVYVPTTLVDHDADREAGYLTLATHLGPRVAYRIGFAAWVACNVGALLLSAQDTFIPRAMLPILAVFGPFLVGIYHAFIGKARDGVERVKGIVLCSFTFLAVNLIWMLMYTGLWVS